MEGKDVKLVLFDLGNVIIWANHEKTYPLLLLWGVPADLVSHFFKNEDYANFARGKLTGQQFYQQLVTVHLRTPLPYEQVVQAHDVHMYGIDEAVAEIFRQVALALPMAFTTDTNPWQTRREGELINLHAYTPTGIFRSNEIGMLKRDEGTFSYIATRLREYGFEPGGVLLVDDVQANLDRASTCGFQTVQFVDADQLRTELGKRSII